VYRRYLGLPARKNTPAPNAVPARSNIVVQQAKATAPTGKRRHSPTALLATGLRYR